MNASAFQQRPLYSIGTVSRLTGVKPDTLRVWERRYNLGASYKGRNGRRKYTQTDVDHLQLIAALVANGARIGDIASSERKTLEQLLLQQGADAPLPPDRRPRVIVLGRRLCDWLDDHQGCLAGVDALVLPTADGAALDQVETPPEGADCLVLECDAPSPTELQRAGQLKQRFDVAKVLLIHHHANQRWVEACVERGFGAMAFPPAPSQLVFEMTRAAAEKEAQPGTTDLGELVRHRPRLFSEEQLEAARSMVAGPACECPRHISELIESLARFEAYSVDCSVENWEDAAAHACIYTFSSQARWLMERALRVAVEGHAGSGTLDSAASLRGARPGTGGGKPSQERRSQ